MTNSFNLKEMQEKLNKSKEIIKTLDDDFDYINRKKEMAELEEAYQNYCKHVQKYSNNLQKMSKIFNKCSNMFKKYSKKSTIFKKCSKT